MTHYRWIAVFVSLVTACPVAGFGQAPVDDAVDEAQQHSAFAELEQFLAQPDRRDRAFLGIIHWFAANEYIAQQRNYKQAVKHLVQAGELGIANPRFLTEIRFQTARLYDLKLHDKKNALKYYKNFVKHYPAAQSTVAVKRFIKQLEGK